MYIYIYIYITFPSFFILFLILTFNPKQYIMLTYYWVRTLLEGQLV